MKDVLDKISSYNIFNYLFPGIIYVVISKEIAAYDFILENNFLGAFLYYFIGMIISRFGSIIIEPFLKFISFLKYREYKFYVAASKQDPKLELLSEVNNTYRTIVSSFLLLLLSKLYKTIAERCNISDTVTITCLTILLLILFLYSYRKQTNFIGKRIDANTNSAIIT